MYYQGNLKMIFTSITLLGFADLTNFKCPLLISNNYKATGIIFYNGSNKLIMFINITMKVC